MKKLTELPPLNKPKYQDLDLDAEIAEKPTLEAATLQDHLTKVKEYIAAEDIDPMKVQNFLDLVMQSLQDADHILPEDSQAIVTLYRRIAKQQAEEAERAQAKPKKAKAKKTKAKKPKLEAPNIKLDFGDDLEW